MLFRSKQISINPNYQKSFHSQVPNLGTYDEFVSRINAKKKATNTASSQNPVQKSPTPTTTAPPSGSKTSENGVTTSLSGKVQGVFPSENDFKPVFPKGIDIGIKPLTSEGTKVVSSATTHTIPTQEVASKLAKQKEIIIEQNRVKKLTPLQLQQETIKKAYDNATLEDMQKLAANDVSFAKDALTSIDKATQAINGELSKTNKGDFSSLTQIGRAHV